ncbi:spartin-like [Clytia hemisphaerica]|uniref:Senescence domain-containing protein n=1 Tax=Clytia hemisphaerica TaxID=252671 RepID=A0A7M5V5K0_9CNID
MATCVKPSSTNTKEDSHQMSERLQKLHNSNKDAFKFINEGLNLEDKGKIVNAIACYEKGLRILESGMKTSNSSLTLFPGEAEIYMNLLSKLTKAQKEIIIRLETLKQEQKSSLEPSAPELPDNTVNGHQEDLWQDAKELVNIKEGVKLFHVDDKGVVSPWTSTNVVLQIFQILKDSITDGPDAFLKCGEWMYPLEPGKSPVLKTQNTYMFPDVNIKDEVAIEGDDLSHISCVGIVLSDLVSDPLRQRFERILKCYGDFRISDKPAESFQPKTKPKRPPPPSTKRNAERTISPTSESTLAIVSTATKEISDQLAEQKAWSDKISVGINIGSQWISWGLLKGAEYTSVLMEKGATSLQQRIKPENKPTVIDPEISHNIRQLHQATGSVVQVSSFLVTSLGALTVNLGKKLAPIVAQQGEKLLPIKYKPSNSESSQKTIEEVKKVGVAGLQGLSIMFLSLEQAGKNLYQTLSKATVQTVQHKYGEEAGDVTHDAMGAAGNALKTVWNVNQLGPKAVAKRALKDTGKAMLRMEDDKSVKKQQ